MTHATYIEIDCKSAINQVSGMPFRWSLNPYRGCVHACQYCYARATHSYFGLDAGRDFETKIFVKRNVVAVARRELWRPSWRGEQVAIGTATDAYQPAEGRYRLMRGLLETFLERRNPLSIVTKSTLIRRDLDLLVELSRQATVRIYFSITTLDRDLWRSLEPGTPPPQQRLRVLEELAAAGVETGVLMAPVLPGLTDDRESLAAMAAASQGAGAQAFHPLPLRLAPLVREHYFAWLADAAPHLTARYRQSYRGTHAPEPYLMKLQERIDDVREEFGFIGERQPMRTAPPLVQQLTLSV
jgi:DNA repair photolyase